MSRTPARVTQADIARATRVAEACDPPRVVEIAPDGTIRIVPVKPEDERLSAPIARRFKVAL